MRTLDDDKTLSKTVLLALLPDTYPVSCLLLSLYIISFKPHIDHFIIEYQMNKTYCKMYK